MLLSSSKIRSELQRMRDTKVIKVGRQTLPCKLIVPPFQLDDDLNFKEIWLQKWEEMLERNGVDETELVLLVDYTLRRRAQGIGKPFFPTDDEWRRILEEMRAGQAQAKVAKAKPPRPFVPVAERPENKRNVLCADCLARGKRTIINVHQMCPVCWPQEEAA
jgi:hypothetical protein